MTFVIQSECKKKACRWSCRRSGGSARVLRSYQQIAWNLIHLRVSRCSIQSSSFNSLPLSNIASDVVDAIKTRVKNICNARCKINYHAPHHHFTGLRLGLPFRVRCYAWHIQLDCWIKKISGSHFLKVRVPFLPCYKYPGGKPADTWSRTIILP